MNVLITVQSSVPTLKTKILGRISNVTLEYDLRDANEIISWVAVRSYEWSEQVKEWRHEWA